MSDKVTKRQKEIVKSVPSRGISLRFNQLMNRLKGKDYDVSNLDTQRAYDEDNLKSAMVDLDSIPPKRRAAILSNIIYESSFDPEAVGDGGLARGYMSWHPDRFNINAWGAKKHDYQLKFTVGDLARPADGLNWTHGGKGTGYKTMNEPQEIFYDPNSTLEQITRAMSMGYARPKHKNFEFQKRLQTARDIYDRIIKVEGEWE